MGKRGWYYILGPGFSEPQYIASPPLSPLSPLEAAGLCPKSILGSTEKPLFNPFGLLDWPGKEEKEKVYVVAQLCWANYIYLLFLLVSDRPTSGETTMARKTTFFSGAIS